MKAHHISPLLLLAAACGAHAAEFEVNSTADSGAGSLRAAIEALNAAADVDGQHDIVFRLPGPAGDIVLQAPLPAIGKRFVRLLGAPTIAPGVRPTIYGDDGPVLALDASVEDAEVRNLSLRDGYATAGACIDAGALASDARLLIDDVVFDSCYVFAVDNDPTPLIGAGLYAAGNVTVLDSVFVEGGFFGGDASSRMDGGGIALRAGSLYVQDTRFETLSVFTDSTSTQCGGGAIWVADGDLTVIDSTFFSTYADCPTGGAGGAIGHTGRDLTLRGVQIEQAGARIGGGVWYGSTRPDARGRIENSVFVDNSVFNVTGAPIANTVGGGLFIRNNINGVSMIARNNTFVRNRSETGPAAHIGESGVTWLAFHSNLLGETGLSANGQPSGSCLVSENSTFPAEPSYSVVTDQGCSALNMQRVDVADLPMAYIDVPDSVLADVRLLPGNVAIDTGSPLAPSQADPFACMVADIEGVARPLDGDGDGDARCDIGAREEQSPRLFGDGFEG